MKKALLSITSFLLVLIILTSCSGAPYSFKNSIDEIESIEIVSAESSLDFTVIKTLSEAEKNDFFERFNTIPFHSYYIGDPMSIAGNAVKITYQNGDYEVVCYYWAEYVKNGEIYFVWKSCDEEIFNELLESFLGEN